MYLMKIMYKVLATQQLAMLWPFLAGFAAFFTLAALLFVVKKRTGYAVTFFIFAALDVTLVLSINFIASDLSEYAATPFSSDNTPVVFYIHSGESITKVAGRLEKLKIITAPEKFTAFARYKQSAGIKKGEYEISRALSPADMIHIFVKGKVKTYKITVPEGWHYRQIAELFTKDSLIDAKKFIAYATDKKLLKSLGVPGDSAEGYIFPDTYIITREYTAGKLITEMINRFKENYTKAIAAKAKKLGMSRNEVVTLASIIEKETGAAAERPLISGVFHNRLKKKMKLQTDPTVIYAELLANGKFDGNITKSDLLRDHPYNTYMRYGLPPGPIASPGRAALEAAVNPAKTDALYFVSKNDGTHKFCPTYECHEKYVNLYQRGGKKKK